MRDKSTYIVVNDVPDTQRKPTTSFEITQAKVSSEESGEIEDSKMTSDDNEVEVEEDAEAHSVAEVV